jgi:hypothetical protein
MHALTLFAHITVVTNIVTHTATTGKVIEVTDAFKRTTSCTFISLIYSN